jgi:ABC-type phosphate/phosphonate transport system substrate-binding protein
MHNLFRIGASTAALLCAGTLEAAEVGGTLSKVSFIPAANAAIAPLGAPAAPASVLAGDALTFSAPPRESAAEAQRLYQPVAAYLTRALGRPVTYVRPRSELSYQKDMAAGAYDIVFDGAHFTSWRIARLNHNALAKIADHQVYAVVTRRDEAQTTDIKQLAGKKVCAAGAADLSTLALLSEFDALRQPLVIEQVGWNKTFDAVVQGQCAAATLPLTVLQKLDGAGVLTRVLHRSRPLPNQAFSAGPRLSAEEQALLSKALTAEAAREALAAVLAANGAEVGLARAAKDDYAGMDRYLKNVWGYGR